MLSRVCHASEVQFASKGWGRHERYHKSYNANARRTQLVSDVPLVNQQLQCFVQGALVNDNSDVRNLLQASVPLQIA
jgi:hypothetical protein